MPLATQRSPISKALWAGSIASTLVVLMLLADSVSKIMKAAPVLKAQAELGFPDSLTVSIGVVLFICTLVYVIPRTSILGAILLTGYLGGAVAVKLRIGEGPALVTRRRVDNSQCVGSWQQRFAHHPTSSRDDADHNNGSSQAQDSRRLTGK